jgi:hypothetical protein
MGPGLPSTRERKVSPGDIRAHDTGSSKQRDGGKTTGPEAGASKNYFTAYLGSPEVERRFCPWLMLFKYCTMYRLPGLSCSLCISSDGQRMRRSVL